MTQRAADVEAFGAPQSRTIDEETKNPACLRRPGVPCVLALWLRWRRDADQKRYSALTETRSESSFKPLFSAL